MINRRIFFTRRGAEIAIERANEESRPFGYLLDVIGDQRGRLVDPIDFFHRIFAEMRRPLLAGNTRMALDPSAIGFRIGGSDPKELNGDIKSRGTRFHWTRDVSRRSPQKYRSPRGAP